MRARWGFARSRSRARYTRFRQPICSPWASTLLDQGKTSESCAKLDAALNIAPDAAVVMINLGLCNVSSASSRRTAMFRAAQRPRGEETAAANQQITRCRREYRGTRGCGRGRGRRRADGHETGHRDRRRAPCRAVGGVDTPFDVEEGARAKVLDLRPPPPPPPHRSSAPWIVGGIGAEFVVGSGALSLVGESQFDGTHDLDT